MLDFGFCLTPFPYTNRKTRFVIEYTGYNLPVSIKSLTGYYQFIKNDEKKRVSFLLPEGATQACNFSGKLITQHPTAIQFLEDFKKENPSITSQYFRYYVMDEKGKDIPFIPNIDDLSSNTGKDELAKGGQNLLIIAVLGGIGYLAFKHYTKGK